MIKFRLFIIALAFLILLPIYIWVIEPTYQRYQIAGQAEAYFNEIPRYPGSTPVEKWQSFYNIGYGYHYRTSDDPLKVISFYKDEIPTEWKLETTTNSNSNKDLKYQRSDSNFGLIISVFRIDNSSLTNPPYDLTISVYKP